MTLLFLMTLFGTKPEWRRRRRLHLFYVTSRKAAATAVAAAVRDNNITIIILLLVCRFLSPLHYSAKKQKHITNFTLNVRVCVLHVVQINVYAYTITASCYSVAVLRGVQFIVRQLIGHA